MKLKKLIQETVILDQFKDIETELQRLKEELELHLMLEGVDDPGILKCVFMAGGPGSGKSFTADVLFGVAELKKDIKTSFSSSGLKVVNSDTTFEKFLTQNGINPKDLAKIEKEDPELWDKITKGDNSLRGRAKAITNQQKAFYEAGRLGMIVDGTGDDYGKISKLKKHAEELGYDTYMVFVNTSLDVAKERNLKRPRTLPEFVVVESWKACQENLGAFQRLFGGNFRIVDNTVYGPIASDIQKALNQFVRKPIYNKIGQEWISTARALKNANLIK